MANRDTQGRLWKCTAKHDKPEDAEICRRAHGASRYWDKSPGYVAEEIEAERDKPASKPVVEKEGTRYGLNAKSWAETWRETWKWAQRVNNAVRYSSRAEFLADVAAHHKLVWEIGYANGNGARHAA